MIAAVEQVPELKPYPCTGWNRRLHRPCDATVIDAYAPAGAIVKRKCHQCGTWQVVRVQPERHDPRNMLS